MYASIGIIVGIITFIVLNKMLFTKGKWLNTLIREDADYNTKRDKPDAFIMFLLWFFILNPTISLLAGVAWILLVVGYIGYIIYDKAFKD